MGNIEKILKKHRVTCAEAEEIFHKAAFVFPDDLHSTEMEKRYVLFGETGNGRCLFVAFTMRGNKIRVISARPMSRKERVWYEEEKEQSVE